MWWGSESFGLSMVAKEAVGAAFLSTYDPSPFTYKGMHSHVRKRDSDGRGYIID